MVHMLHACICEVFCVCMSQITNVAMLQQYYISTYQAIRAILPDVWIVIMVRALYLDQIASAFISRSLRSLSDGVDFCQLLNPRNTARGPYTRHQHSRLLKTWCAQSIRVQTCVTAREIA